MANYFATPFRAIYQTARLVAVLLLVIYGGTTSAATYAFTPAAKSIYESILRLDLEGSAARIDALRLTDPDNRVAEYLESYLDFFRLYLSEDEQLFNRLAPRHERRLERLAEIDPASPYHRYTQAEARLHWALVRIRFESYYPAFREVNKAHKLLRANQAEHPDFLLNYKDLGLIHAAVGAVPDQFRWGVELFSSLSGSVPEGKRELERALLDRNSPFYRETAVLYAFLQLHLDNQPEAAWQTVNRLNLQPATNKLHCFVHANVALRSNHNDAAIKLLSQQPRDRTTADFPYLDFMQGTARLRRLDSGSQVYFVSFLARWRGKHFAKEARQKLAWAELIDGDEAAYRKQMARVTGSGTTAAGGDESALREAERAELPQLDLLKARLLFDGGYFTRARAVLDATDPAELKKEEQLEYYYRTGRVLHGLKELTAALAFYERTVSDGTASARHFACSAALQAGLVEEGRGRTVQARRYFERCLTLEPSEYATGLHLQAKAGLSRL